MRLFWTSAITAVAFTFIGLPTALAAAEDRPEAEQSRVGMEVDFLHLRERQISTNIVTTDLVAHVGVTRHVFLDADVPAGLFVSPGFAEGVLGNPMIGAQYAGRFNHRFSGFAGLAVGIPVARATAPDFTDELGWAAIKPRAWHEPYRFIAHVLPVVARAGLEVDLAPAFLRFELSPGVLIRLRHSGYGYAYIDVSATAGLRASFGLEGGLRAQGTFLLVKTSVSDDLAQTAIEPFIGYAAPKVAGLYVRYGFLMALDAPLGFASDDTHVVTHRVSVGAKF